VLRNLFTIGLILSATLSVGVVDARTSLNPDLYSVELVTDQGFEQFEFKAHKQIIIISEPVNIPIPFKPSDSFRVAVDVVNAHAPENAGEALPIGQPKVISSSISKIERGDFDGDGYIDLFVVVANWQSVFIVMGGDGNIPNNVIYFSGEDVLRFQAGYTLSSVNGDGITDIYFASSGVDKTVYNLVGVSNETHLAEIEQAGVFYDDKYLAIKESSLVGPSGLFYAVNELTGDLVVSQSVQLPVAKGVMPQLNVSYSSAFNAGGREWSIGPVSKITVCYQKDGTRNYGELKENICLDGQLLKRDLESGKYLLIDPSPGSYVEITDLGNGKYKLDNGAGITKIYGDSSSRFGKVSYISSVTGIYGEEIKYSYDRGLLESISYGFFEVDIQYAEVDTSLFHIDGYAEVSSSLGNMSDGRLYRIEVKDNGEVISRKNFFYEKELEGRLLSIQQCYYTPNEKCEEPYYFEYNVGFYETKEYDLEMPLNEFKAADFTSYENDRITGAQEVEPVAILGKVTKHVTFSNPKSSSLIPEKSPHSFWGYKVKKYDFESNAITLSEEYQAIGNRDPFVFTYNSDIETFSLGLTPAVGFGETGDSGFLLQGNITGASKRCRNGDSVLPCPAPVLYCNETSPYLGRKGEARVVESSSSESVSNFDFVNSTSGLNPHRESGEHVTSAYKRHDLNRDGRSSFMSAFIFYDGNYKLGIQGFSENTASIEVGFSTSEIEIYGPFDLDYDGNDELYIKLALDKGYIVEVDSNGTGKITSAGDSDNFGIIQEPNFVYGDFNGDSLLDAVSTSGSDIQYYSGIYRIGSTVKYGRVSQLGTVSAATVTIGGLDVPNILSIDYDRDGKDELWIAGALYSVKGDRLEQDQKAKGYSFSCDSIACMKIADYDHDKVPELFEWKNGKVVTHKLVAKQKQVSKATYDSQVLFEADYEDVFPELSTNEDASASAADSVFLLRKQKVSALYKNNGSKGWVKIFYSPQVAAFAGDYSGHGYTQTLVDYYSTLEVSSSAPSIDDLVYSDEVLGGHFRGSYYAFKTNRSFYDSGVVDSVVNEIDYSYKSENGSGYLITKRNKKEVLGSVTTQLTERQYIVDKYGRLSNEISNESGAKVEIQYLYEHSDWPSFPSQSISSYVEAGEPYIDITQYTPLANKPLLWKTDFHFGNPELAYQVERIYHPNYDVHKVITSVNDSLSASIADRTMAFTDYERGLPKTVTTLLSGQQVNKEYDLFGRTTSESSNGHDVTYTYDVLGRLSTVSDNTVSDNTGLTVSYKYEKCDGGCIGGASYITEMEMATGAVNIGFFDTNGFVVGEHDYNLATGKSTYSMRKFNKFGRLSAEYRDVESLLTDLPFSYEYYSDGGLKKIVEPGPLQLDGIRTPVETNYSYAIQSGGLYCGGDSQCLKKTAIQSSASSLIFEETIATPERINITYIQKNNGRIVGSESAGGTSKYFGYDMFGNISSVKETGDIAGDDSTVDKDLLFKRIFNVSGMLVATERPGRGAEYKTFSPFGEILKETYASGSTVSYTYDGAGRIQTKIYSGTNDLPGRTYSWMYDFEKPGMLDEIRYQEADEDFWTSIYEYDYDAYGRPETERNKLSSVSLERQFDYNSQGLGHSLSMSAVGAPDSAIKLVTSYQGGVQSGVSLALYNAELEEEERQPLWSTGDWDFRGRQLSVDYFGSSMSMDVELDKYRSIILNKNIKHTDLGVLDGEAVYFDTHGDPRLKVGTEGGQTVDSLILSYDEDHRLTSVDDRVGMLSSVYDMDDFGNFNFKHNTNNKYEYDLAESAAESSVGSGAIAYSKLADGTYTGHMSNIAGYTVAHNEKGQPYSISGAQGGVAFTYGPFDELVAVNYSDGETLQLWGGMQISTGGDYGTFYRYRVGDVVLIRGDVNGDFITYKDYLGSERSIWTPNGELVAGATYDAYGKKISSIDLEGYGFVSERGYTSHLELKGFPFIHMGNRLYSPEFALFTSIDPVFDSMYRTGGLNGYGYVSGNPYKYWDPSGRALVALTEYEHSNVSGSPNLEQWAQDLAIDSIASAPVVNIDTIEVNASNGLETAVNVTEDILGNPVPGAMATTGALILATKDTVLTNSGTRIPTLPLTYGMDIKGYNQALAASKNLHMTGNGLGYAGFTLSVFQYTDAVGNNDWDRAQKVSTTAFYSALMMSPPWLITIPIGMTGVWVTNNDGSLLPQ
jgi:RHS repeat-associated protein